MRKRNSILQKSSQACNKNTRGTADVDLNKQIAIKM